MGNAAVKTLYVWGRLGVSTGPCSGSQESSSRKSGRREAMLDRWAQSEWHGQGGQDRTGTHRA